MNLLVIRMSAIGDVALTLPAIRSMLDHYPDVHISLVTRASFLPFFENIDRLTLITADVKNRHKGIAGLYRLYKEIEQQFKPDTVIDLHDVLRSRLLGFYFKMGGTPVFRIDKGRKEKKQLTARYDKQLKPLKHTLIRYLDVFKNAGYPVHLSSRSIWFNKLKKPLLFLQENGLDQKTAAWVGIAPFAKHREKRWPLEKMKAVIAALQQQGYQVFLFGGGKEEITSLQSIADKYPDVWSVAGKLILTEELGLMQQLDVMISMDSANMHLAALSGIPVISIWGATHPYAGFGPLNDNEKNIVQVSTAELSCRPCSVFGNKPCFRGDHACMEWIGAEAVIGKVQQVLGLPLK